MAFPENCLRGVPNDSFVRKGVIGSELFYFYSRDSRDDGWTEQSINWQDDEQTIEFTLSQLKENSELHFKTGVVIIRRFELDRIRDRYAHMNLLSYERQATEENPHHGNILLNNEMVDSPLMKQVASAIALYSEFVPRSSNGD